MAAVPPYNDPANQSLQAQIANATREFLRNSAAISEKAVVVSVSGGKVLVQPLTQIVDTAGNKILQPMVEVPVANIGGGGGIVKIDLIAGDVGILLIPIRNDGDWNFEAKPLTPKDRKLFSLTAAVFVPLAGATTSNWMIEGGENGLKITATKITINSTLPMEITSPVVTIHGSLIVDQSIQTPAISFGSMAPSPGVVSIAVNAPMAFNSTASFTGASQFTGVATMSSLILNGISVESHGHISSNAGNRTGNPVA